MDRGKPTVITPCPDCQEEIDLGPTPELGEKITCPNCWAYLEIIGLDPVRLRWDTAESEDDDGVE